jgi:tetratricopeptide (TPR) repeat protein
LSVAPVAFFARGFPSRILVTCGILAFTATAEAQPQYNDYYKARTSKGGAALIRKVELYHLEPATTKMQAGKYQYALGDVEFILRYFPNHPRGLALISELCDVKWRNTRCDSESAMRMAIEINPNASATYVVNGVHLQRRGRVPEAIQSYQRAIALDPRSANAHYNLGLIYLEQKQFDLANHHAQLAYALGMPYPALRDKLVQAGQWKPIDAEALKRELSPQASARTDVPAK